MFPESKRTAARVLKELHGAPHGNDGRSAVGYRLIQPIEIDAPQRLLQDDVDDQLQTSLCRA